MSTVIAFFGQKQSGKGTCSTLLSGLTLVSNKIITKFEIEEEHCLRIDKKTFNINSIAPNICRIYSFAELLKRWCVEVFDIDPKLVFGTDEQKSHHTHLKWENMPGVVCNKQIYREMCKVGNSQSCSNISYHKSGFMTGREVLQFFGTDICRKMFSDCWTKYLLDKIEKDSPKYAFIADGRFDNEFYSVYNKKGTCVLLTRNYKSDGHSSENSLSEDLPFQIVVDSENLSKPQMLENLVSQIKPLNILAP